MDKLEDIMNYLLLHGINNRINAYRKLIEDKFVYDNEPITIDDLKKVDEDGSKIEQSNKGREDDIQ